jgi:hypothetical protein
MLRLRLLALAGVIACGLAGSASAAQIDRTFDITVSDFYQTFGFDPTPPPDPVHLNVTFQFDNSADVATTTTGLTINSFDLPYSAEWQYFAGSDGIALATDLPAPASCSSAPATFCAFLHNVTSTAPSLVFFQNSLPTAPEYNVWQAGTIALSYSDAPVRGGAPEPTAWALLLMGFGGLGAAMRSARSRGPARA